MRNVAKIYEQLPLFPGDLEVIIVKPTNYADNPLNFGRQFNRDFKVRKSHIEAWLRCKRSPLQCL